MSYLLAKFQLFTIVFSLDRTTPVPTLQAGSEPLHTFLGYERGQHILCMSARDPLDDRELPANGKDHISAFCIRGVRKVGSLAYYA